MFKSYLKIYKDYSKIVSYKDKKLILFIVFNLLSNIVSLFLPIFASLIIEKVTEGFYNKALVFVICLFILYVVFMIISYFDYYFYACFFKDTYINVHTKLINSVYKFDEEFTKKISFGKVINSSNMDIINVAEIPSFMFELIVQIIKFVVIVLIFFKESLFIGFYVLIVNFIYFKCSIYCNKKNEFYFRKQRKYADRLTGVLSQILNGLKDVKSYNLSEKLNNKLDIFRKKWGSSYFLKRKYYFIKKTFVAFIENFGKVLLYIFLIILIVNGKIKIAIFLLFVSYYEKLISSTNEIMEALMMITEESVSLYRIMDILCYSRNLLSSEGEVKTDEITGIIEFLGVSFKYEKLPILNNVTFKVYPNMITTIVGETGAGKSTIINLLMRFYKIDDGKILIDGINIYDYSDKVYSSNVTVVNQKTFLFNMSIRDNLSLVDSNKERQENACKRVGIHDFIMSLPKGYNTIIREGTNNIGGGQKQLLAIARALLTSSEIILLDEITSSLDPKSTGHIISLLKDLATDHTILVVTHNKDLMAMSDMLFMIKNGKIVAKGKHGDLIKDNKFYMDLFNKSI